MNTQLEQAVIAADVNAQYDTYAKKLLSNKVILAHILKGTIPELADLSPDEIIPLIEGEVRVSEVPIEPGVTNKYFKAPGSLIKGNNTESSEPKEGTVTYDIICYVRLLTRLSKMIVNIEAQKDASPGYPIMNRAVFYTSRMISSQKERDFTKSHYEDMVDVYSIWLCFNMDENCMNHFYIADETVFGDYEWVGNRNLFNIMLVGLDKKYLEYTKWEKNTSELHDMLGIIFSNRLNGKEKVSLLQDKLCIPVDEEVREELNEMCNLSYGIEEKGIEKGRMQTILEYFLNGGK